MAKSPEVKLAVLGRAGVGKSALVVRFLTKRFIWEYDPTLESTHRHEATIDDELVTMEILDTAGQEEPLPEGALRWADGFLLVYDITDAGSFGAAAALAAALEERRRPLVLAGTKADLEHARAVAPARGRRLAADLACAFFEVSASAGGGGVAAAFHELCREVRRRRAAGARGRRRSSTTQVKLALNKMLTKMSS